MDGSLTNKTSETMLVYGPQRDGETRDNSLYKLPPNRKTPAGWDCDGFFVPNDRIADQALDDRQGPVAIKYRDFRSPIIVFSRPNTYKCHFNGGVYKAGELNWEIPNVSHATAIATYPEVPAHEST